MELEKLEEGRKEAKVTKTRYSNLDVCVGSIPDSSDGYPQSTYAHIPLVFSVLGIPELEIPLLQP